MKIIGWLLAGIFTLLATIVWQESPAFNFLYDSMKFRTGAAAEEAAELIGLRKKFDGKANLDEIPFHTIDEDGCYYVSVDGNYSVNNHAVSGGKVTYLRISMRPDGKNAEGQGPWKPTHNDAIGVADMDQAEHMATIIVAGKKIPVGYKGTFCAKVHDPIALTINSSDRTRSSGVNGMVEVKIWKKPEVT